MKFYISQEDRKTIRKNYPRLINEEMFIIDIPNLLTEVRNENDPYIDKYDMYLINQTIDKRLHGAYNSKRYSNILYIVEKIDRRLLYSLRKYFRENKIYFTEFILLDYSQNLDTKLYKFFDNIL